MKDVLLISLIALYGLTALYRLLYAFFLWQLKEYRLDRIWVHLRTPVGKRWLVNVLTVIKTVSLVVYLLIPQIQAFIYPLVGLYSIELFIYIRRGISGVKIPKPTPKIIIFALVAVVLQVFLLIQLKPLTKALLFADRVLPLSITFLMIITKPLAFMYKKILILRARRKLKRFPQLIRIGVTGSYGKTTTKDILAAILAEKYQVVKTPENQNTDVGIAKVILSKQVTARTQVLVAEMGAYKRGEIKAAARLAAPSVGIVTGINTQHIALFGNLANTRRAKYELIESLPEGGVAIFNFDNEYTRKMAIETKEKRVLTYGQEKGAKAKIETVQQLPDQLKWTVAFGDKKLHLSTPLIGEHTVYNATAAALVALELGVSQTKVESALKKIKPRPGTLHIAGVWKDATLVDDTYNANPDGIKVAMDYLETFSGKKILILTPLIELGKETDSIHARLARYAGEHDIYVLLTNNTQLLNMRTAAQKINPQCTVDLIHSKSAQALLKTLAKGDVVVFAGREAQKLLMEYLE